MATALHVFRRKGIFYWRRRLPPVMAAILQTTHLCRSLRTADRRIANHCGMLISMAIDQLEDDLNVMVKPQQPTKGDLNKILLEIFNYFLDMGEFRRAAASYGSDPWRNPTSVRDEETRAKYSALGLEKPEDIAEAAKDMLTMNERDIAERYARPLFRRYNLAYFVDAEGIGYKEHIVKRSIFERMVLAAIATAERFNAERDNGIYNPAVFPFASNEQEAKPHSPLEAWERQKVSDLIQQYRDARLPDVSNSMLNKIDVAGRLFVELVGDIPARNITRQDAARFRNRLDELPNEYSQNEVYRKLSPSEIIERAKEIRRQLDTDASEIAIGEYKLNREKAHKAAEPLHPKTTNSHISTMHGFFKWLKKDGFFGGENPFSEVGHSKKRIEKQLRASGGKSRAPWPSDIQKKLFSHPRWNGFDNVKNTNTPGHLIIEDENFWAPLISIFTGMREEEILQLWTKDIRRSDGVDYIDVNECIPEGKQLKTIHSSSRIIPIHSELIKIGFLEYVKAARKANSRLLFPGAMRSPMKNGKIGRLGTYYTRTFTRIRENREIPLKYKFHSLRNTFFTALDAKNNNLTPFPARFLMGHLNDKNATGYGDFRQPRNLKEFVEKVKPEIDFSFLYFGRQNRRYDFTEHPSRKNDQETK